MDTSPLTGPQHNAGVRLGLLLRLHRLCDPEERFPRQSDLLVAARRRGHHATATALSRAESGEARSSLLLRAYEDLLGLEDGALQAVAATLCRSQPLAPADRDPVPTDLDVQALSAVAEQVLAAEVPASAWYAFGRAFSQPQTRGLPVPMMRTAVDRLLADLRTTGGVGWVMRLEALRLLQEGPYAALVPSREPPRSPAQGGARTHRTKDRRNPEWTWSQQASHALTSAEGLPESPVLARALYDVLAAPTENLVLDAGVTLTALPFAPAAIDLLRETTRTCPDPHLRTRLAHRLRCG